MKTQQIVQKLWNLCNVLRDDGITYHQYVTELTYILFLKMAHETGNDSGIPEEYRWAELVKLEGLELYNLYRRLLVDLGTAPVAAKEDRASAESSIRRLVRQIYANAGTNIEDPANLNKIIKSIDKLDWYSAKEEGLGELYEGLLEKNAGEKKSGAGQYFTPRPLINLMVRLLAPQVGERCNDPAAGTFGFMIAADRYLKQQTDSYFTLGEEQARFQKEQAFSGCELVQDAHRLALMNAMLHGIEGPIVKGDTLSGIGASFKEYDVVLTNPPFGTKKGGELPSRTDLTFKSSNKQLNFLQHIYRSLKTGGSGRAAVVLPDNVLFQEGDGRKVREDLLTKCNLHTILRLPTGIFYAQGVKTNVLFFQRGVPTRETWIYDCRTNLPNVTKKDRPLTEKLFAEFEACYGADPNGGAERTDGGESGRFRRFTLADIAAREYNLDITWLRDESHQDPESLPEPHILAADAITELSACIDELREIMDFINVEDSE
ncbi:MAG: N-6 DNA methylase [bacterium]|nr:N-6 DNA methylase [bacterium]